MRARQIDEVNEIIIGCFEPLALPWQRGRPPDSAPPDRREMGVLRPQEWCVRLGRLGGHSTVGAGID